MSTRDDGWNLAEGELLAPGLEALKRLGGGSAYEVFDPVKGAPRRSSYVVDRQGRLTWSVHNANPDGRDLDEHLRELHAAVS